VTCLVFPFSARLEIVHPPETPKRPNWSSRPPTLNSKLTSGGRDCNRGTTLGRRAAVDSEGFCFLAARKHPLEHFIVYHRSARLLSSHSCFWRFNALLRPAAETLQWEDQCCGSRLRPLKVNPEISPTTEAQESYRQPLLADWEL
jgi:hypothetical protein